MVHFSDIVRDWVGLKRMLQLGFTRYLFKLLIDIISNLLRLTSVRVTYSLKGINMMANRLKVNSSHVYFYWL